MADDGIERSALLLLALGEDHAAEVMKHLSPREVQKLGSSMAAIKAVPHDKMKGMLDSFYSTKEVTAPLQVDDDYIRTVLNKALGEDKAAGIINRILAGNETAGIEGLKWMDATTVADLIRNEHPQIIATILVHLEHDQASGVLASFPDRLRSDVVLRIATLDGVQPVALRELNDVMVRLLRDSGNIKKATMGGVRTAAEILNFMGTAHETAVLDAVREYDPDLAQAIIDEMFVFENINDLDDRAVQLLLREVQSESLITALKGSSDALKEKVFRNMSSRAADMLREDLESKGPVKLSEVEAEQKEILKVVRRLADEGQITMGPKGEDQYV